MCPPAQAARGGQGAGGGARSHRGEHVPVNARSAPTVHGEGQTVEELERLAPKIATNWSSALFVCCRRLTVFDRRRGMGCGASAPETLPAAASAAKHALGEQEQQVAGGGDTGTKEGAPGAQPPPPASALAEPAAPPAGGATPAGDGATADQETGGEAQHTAGAGLEGGGRRTRDRVRGGYHR